MNTKVQGYCPACGHHTLFVGSGGYLTCSISDCPEPDAASTVLEDAETAHVVEFGDSGFSIRHPLRERIADRLMTCELQAHCERLDGPPVRPGRYRAVPLGARWSWAPLREVQS